MSMTDVYILSGFTEYIFNMGTFLPVQFCLNKMVNMPGQCSLFAKRDKEYFGLFLVNIHIVPLFMRGEAVKTAVLEWCSTYFVGS